MGIGGIWFMANAMIFLDTSLRVDGTVVALERKRNAKGFDTYHPVVQFMPTEPPEIVEFTSRFGIWPSPFAVSDSVEVAYDPTDPTRARINSFWTIWFLPMLLVVFGSACGLAGYHTLRHARSKAGAGPEAKP